jgi:hypothetical protein
MPEKPVAEQDSQDAGRIQSAVAEFVAGPIRMTARASATPAGLVAMGAMASSILLATAVLVWAARRRS